MKKIKDSLFSFTKKKSDPENNVREGLFIPSTRRLGSCMTHRSDIVWIDSAMKKEEILNIVRTHSRYNRFPVCTGTVDTVVGVLLVRTYLDSLLEPVWPGLKALVKKPIYLPETVTIVKTLSMLEEADCQLAFIIDEYGGIEGMVTRNGIISELLVELTNEDAGDDPDIFERSDGSYLIGGQIRMEDIRDLFDLPDAVTGSHEYHTLAGYLLSLNRSIPKTGDRIEAGPYLCEIVDMDGHRIDKVLITKLPAQDAQL